MVIESNNTLVDQFVYWQCQIRKFSVRNLEARPTSGICPDLIVNGNNLGSITTLIVPNSPENDISHLKHAYQKTYDPKKRREAALKYLQSEFYQFPNQFSGELTALAARKADWVDQVMAAEQVQLIFEQDSRHWQLGCDVELLSTHDMRWQFTLAHNQLFNPGLTPEIQVLVFKPVLDKTVSN